MSPSLRIAAAAAVVLFAAPPGHAQFYLPPGYKPKPATITIRTGPNTTITLPATVFDRTVGQYYPYGILPPWYYAPVVPVPVPVPVQDRPPVIIQNIVPPAAEPPAGRPAFPNEFDPNPPKGAPKKDARAGKPAPPKPDVGVAAPNPKVAPKAAGIADADRAVEAGKKSFADGQYGRALELFKRAVTINPQDPAGHYLVSQAAFALGKYRDAVAAIAAGVALRADWADARFASRDLYWKKADIFDNHLKALREAVTAFPDDPVLLFLLGHQLWFDHKPADAKPYLQKALALGKDQTPAGAFPLR